MACLYCDARSSAQYLRPAIVVILFSRPAMALLFKHVVFNASTLMMFGWREQLFPAYYQISPNMAHELLLGFWDVVHVGMAEYDPPKVPLLHRRKESSEDSPVHAVPNIVEAHKQIKAEMAELLEWMEEELEPRNRKDDPGRVPFWSTHWKIEDYIHALRKQADLIETWVRALKDLKNSQAETVSGNLPKSEL